MHPIDNISNNKIKEIIKLHQKKYREETGLFLVEGQKAVQELIDANVEIVEIYATKEPKVDYHYTLINESTMKKVSTTSSPCEILAIAKQRKIEKSKFKNFKKIVKYL